MNEQQRKNVEEAISFLKNFNQEKPKGLIWNYTYYGLHNAEHPPEENNYCGIAACALGALAIAGKANVPAGKWKKDYDRYHYHWGKDPYDVATEVFGMNLEWFDYTFGGNAPATYIEEDGVYRTLPADVADALSHYLEETT